MTTVRLRHGIVLALIGLLLGLGLVLGLAWVGRLPQDEAPQQGKLSALAPDAARPGQVGDEAGDKAGDTTRETKSAEPDAAKPAPGSGNRPSVNGETPSGAEAGKAAAGKAEAGTAGVGKATGAPSFDIVRVEPNGDAVVAGRGRPNTVVEMLVDGKPVARALADPNGQFAIVPPALPKGSSEIVLRSRTADGQETRSSQSVAVSVAPEGKSRPLVALTAPDAPTVVLSQPGSPETPPANRADKGTGEGGTTSGATASQTAKPAQTAPTRIVSVDAEPGGRLFVTGMGKPGTEVRLYLNDTLIAPARIGPDGRVTFTIGSGVSQGQYQVRIDEIDPKSGRVLRRAEVPFAMPQQVADAAKPDHPKDARAKPEHMAEAGRPATGTPERSLASPAPRSEPMVVTPPPVPPAAIGRAETGEGPSAPGAVFVPAIATARITRGDNLWQISKRVYGRGERYTVIYDANQGQIRDPDLIYPGQIFVLPNERRG